MNIKNILNSIDNIEIFNLLDFASENIILPFHGKLKSSDIFTKSRNDDFVTVADKETEVFLSQNLLKILKNSRVVGEESLMSKSGFLDCVNNYEFIWTCDPIDGTFNFVNGKNNFCVMISLCYKLIPISAWLVFPKLNLKLMANKFIFKFFSDKYAYLDLLHKIENSFEKRIINNKFVGAKNLRCAGLEAILCSIGKIDYLYHTNLTPWDHSPVDIICRSSGCNVHLLDKSPFKIVSNGKLLVSKDKNSWEKLSKIFNT